MLKLPPTILSGSKMKTTYVRHNPRPLIPPAHAHDDTPATTNDDSSSISTHEYAFCFAKYMDKHSTSTLIDICTSNCYLKQFTQQNICRVLQSHYGLNINDINIFDYLDSGVLKSCRKYVRKMAQHVYDHRRLRWPDPTQPLCGNTHCIQQDDYTPEEYANTSRRLSMIDPSTDDCTRTNQRTKDDKKTAVISSDTKTQVRQLEVSDELKQYYHEADIQALANCQSAGLSSKRSGERDSSHKLEHQLAYAQQ